MANSPAPPRSGLQHLIFQHFQSNELRRLAQRVIVDEAARSAAAGEREERHVRTGSAVDASPRTAPSKRGFARPLRRPRTALDRQSQAANLLASPSGQVSQPPRRRPTTGDRSGLGKGVPHHTGRGRHTLGRRGSKSSSGRSNTSQSSSPRRALPSSERMCTTLGPVSGQRPTARPTHTTPAPHGPKAARTPAPQTAAKHSPPRSRKQPAHACDTPQQPQSRYSLDKSPSYAPSPSSADARRPRPNRDPMRPPLISRRDTSPRKCVFNEEESPWTEDSIANVTSATKQGLDFQELDVEIDPTRCVSAAATRGPCRIGLGPGGPVLLPFRDSSFKKHTIGQMCFNPDGQRWENTCSGDEQEIMEAFETASWGSASSTSEASAMRPSSSQSHVVPGSHKHFELSVQDLEFLQRSEESAKQRPIPPSPSPLPLSALAQLAVRRVAAAAQLQ